MAAKKLTQEEIDQLKKDLVEIEQLATRLDRVDIDISGFSELEKSAPLIKLTLKQLRDEWETVTSDSSTLSKSFRNIVQEISQQNIGLKDSLKAYRGLISIADQLQSYQRGGRNLNEKDIAYLKERADLEQIQLKESNDLLKIEEKTSETSIKSLSDKIDGLNKVINQNTKLKKDNTSNLELLEKTEKLKAKEEKNLKQIRSALEFNNSLIEDKEKLFKNLNLVLNETLRQIKKEFAKDLDKSFQSVVKEIQTTDTTVKKTAKTFDFLTSVAQKFQDHQNDINKLNEKDVKVITEKLASEEKRLQNYIVVLKKEEIALNTAKTAQEFRKKSLSEELTLQEQELKLLTEQDAAYTETSDKVKKLRQELSKVNESQSETLNNIEINKITQSKITENLDKQNGAYEKMREKLERIKNEQENIRKTLGLSGVAADGLEQALNKIGFGGLAKAMGIEDARDQMRTLAEEIVKNQEEEITLRKQVEEKKQELASKGYDQVVEKLNKEKQLEEEIATVRGKLSDAQIKAGFGGKALKDKQKELELAKASITEEDKLLIQEAELNKLNEEQVNSLHKQNAQYKGINGQVSVLKKGLQVTGANLAKNLKDPLSLALALIGQMVVALTEADKATGELAKQANMTYSAASSLRQEFGRISELSMDSAVTIKGLQESYLAISETIGAQVDINAANLELMTKLRERAGITNETYGSMLNYAAATGQEVESTVTGFLGGAKALGLQANKVINVKQLLVETSKTSNAIKLSIVGGAEALGRAAAQAKMLGMTLNQVDKIAGSLLQFEDSISAELSAELLTGKELNLERARYAALTGDVETLSKEIAQNIGSAADFTNMNRIQQEALAKAVGMTREELADTLVEQEAFGKLGRKLKDEEKAAYEFAKEKYGLEKAAKMVGEGELDDLMKQQSIQDRFNQSIEKLKEIFVSIADPVLQIVSPLADLVSAVLPAVNAFLSPLMEGFRVLAKTITYIVESTKALLGYFTGSNKELTTMQAIVGSIASIYLGYVAAVKAGLVWQGISAAFSERKALAENASKISIVAQRIAEGAALPFKAISAALSGTKAIAEVTAAEALTAGLVTIAIVGGLAMVAAAMSKANSQAVQVKDGVIDRDKKAVTLSGEFGTVQLDKNDKIYDAKDGKIKVGTDLLGDKKMSKDKMIPSSNTINTTSQEASKDVSKDTSNIFNKLFKNVSKEKEIANVAQNAFTVSKDKNMLSKEKEIINNIVENISTSAIEEISKETNVFKSPIEKTKEITFNNDKLKNTNVLNKTLSYIDKTSDLKTETLTKAANQLVFDSTNKLKVNTLINDKQQSDQTKEQTNKFLSTINKEKEFTTIAPNENSNLPESSFNIANNTDKTTSSTTTNNNIVNQASANNVKIMRELTQSFQSLLEENKRQNTVLKYIADKNSDIYIDSTKAGTADRIGATNIGR
jgi:hypothetical protein